MTPRSDATFRRLADTELPAAYAVYLARFEWLRAGGIRQWALPMPFGVFQRRQHAGQNYAGLQAGEVAGLVALVTQASPHWRTELGLAELPWISTLITAPRLSPPGPRRPHSLRRPARTGRLRPRHRLPRLRRRLPPRLLRTRRFQASRRQNHFLYARNHPSHGPAPGSDDEAFDVAT